MPIEIEGGRVELGDIVFAEHEGVSVIRRVGEWDVFAAAFDNARGEKVAHRDLQNRVTAVAAFGEYGIF